VGGVEAVEWTEEVSVAEAAETEVAEAAFHEEEWIEAADADVVVPCAEGQLQLLFIYPS
jgi:glutamate dehydrogenase/leucine dehydrogenase